MWARLRALGAETLRVPCTGTNTRRPLPSPPMEGRVCVCVCVCVCDKEKGEEFHCSSVETNLTGIGEDTGLILGLIQWVGDLALL